MRILTDDWRLWVEIGFAKDEFDELFRICLSVLVKPLEGERTKTKKLTARETLLLVCMWLCRYHTYKELEIIFGIATSTICKYISRVVPKLVELMKGEIEFPSPERIQALLGTIPEFPSAIGSVNLTAHKIHQPVAQEYHMFCGDKRFHFFNNLAFVNCSGLFIHYEPGYGGRLSDTACFLLTSEALKRWAEGNSARECLHTFEVDLCWTTQLMETIVEYLNSAKTLHYYTSPRFEVMKVIGLRNQ